MSGGVFVTGTDTEVGKSWVAAGLIVALRRRGFTVAGMKPVASGCEEAGGGLRNDDALLLQSVASEELPYGLINPYTFVPPLAPHIAAAEAGVAIEPARIIAAYRELDGRAERVVVEGVGGWLVPLAGEYRVADLAADLDLPVVLVVGMRLGCINHALLSAESIRARGCTLAGWVANRVDGEMGAFEENLATLREQLPAPLLGVVPHLPEADPERVADALAVEGL